MGDADIIDNLAAERNALRTVNARLAADLRQCREALEMAEQRTETRPPHPRYGDDLAYGCYICGEWWDFSHMKAHAANCPFAALAASRSADADQ